MAERKLTNELARRACFEDDEAAWTEIYNRVYHRLVEFMHSRRGLNWEDANDVASEAFIYAWKNRRKWDPEKGGIFTFIVACGRAKLSHHNAYRFYKCRDARKTERLVPFEYDVYNSIDREHESTPADMDNTAHNPRLMDPQPSVEEQVAWKDTLERFIAALGDPTEPLRATGNAAIKLILEEGQMSNEDIGLRLGVTRQAVNLALQSIRKRYRRSVDLGAVS